MNENSGMKDKKRMNEYDNKILSQYKKYHTIIWKWTVGKQRCVI